MRGLIKSLEKSWRRDSGATASDLKNVEQAIRRSLPIDYKLFLQWSDGGEGQLGDRYLVLWKANELMRLNYEYEVATYLPGMRASASVAARSGTARLRHLTGCFPVSSLVRAVV